MANRSLKIESGLEDGQPMPRRLWSAASLTVSILFLVMGTSIVNPAMPAIAQSFSASNSDVVWLVNGFQMALVVSLLGFSALGQKIGRRALFQLGVGLFTLGALCCAFAPNLQWMIAARLAQGLGAAATLCIVGAIQRSVYPRSRTGFAVALTSVTVALSSGLSPIVGSAILTYATWPWIFLGLAPFGLVTLGLSAAMPANRASAAPVDWRGCLLGAATLGLFAAGVREIGADIGLALAALIGSAVFGSLLVRHSRSSAHPIVPVDLLSDARIRLAATASVFCFAGNMVVLTALPFFLIVDLQRPQMEAGVLMSLWPFTIVASAVIAGALGSRFREEALCVTGSAIMAAGIGVLCWGALHGQLPFVAAGVSVTAFGFGLFQGPNNRVLLLSGPFDRVGGAAVIQSTARELGNVTGVGVVAAIFAVFGSGGAINAFLVAGILVILTGLSNFRRLLTDAQ